MVWDACFCNDVAAFRLCLVTPGRCRNRICTNRTTDDKYCSPLRPSVICSRQRRNELCPLRWVLNWDALETMGAVLESHVLGLVASEMSPHRFALVIKQAAPTGVLVLLIVSLLAGCTSMTNDTISDPSSSQSGAAVPGEKMSDDQRFAPGPMGSGNVKW